MGRNSYRRGLALLLAACALLSCASCGGKVAAAAMHLRKTEGTVGVLDDGGKDLEPRENLGLYSGYGVDTRSESYAWIDLDDVKLTKLDQDSEIKIKKEDKHLEIEVLSGSLFFNVTKPLADDESLNIRTSTMAVGIRGTCGWVEVPDSEHMNVYLLEGKVECSTGSETATVNAGEMAAMTAEGEITVEPFFLPAIPAFVEEEIEGREDIPEIPDTTKALFTKAYQYQPDGTLIAYYEYTYDEQGHLIRNDNYSSQNGTPVFAGRSEFSYDDQGERLEMRVYDKNGALTERQVPITRTADYIVYAAYNASGEEIYQYTTYLDEQGRTTSEVIDDNRLIYEYDQAGKRTRKTNYGSDGTVNDYMEYQYD